MKPITGKKATIALCSLLVAIVITGTFSADMYVPSLPYIVEYFGVTPASVKLTITLYLMGFASLQLLYGPLSDKYGRKKILLLGLGIGFVGSIICVAAPSIHFLWLGRFIQGMGIGACASLTRSIAQDVFEGERLVRVASYLSIAFGVAPAIAPVVGGYLEKQFTWRSVFIALTGYIIFLVILILRFLPETLAESHHHAIKPKVMLQTYHSMIKSFPFMAHVLCASLALSGLMAYYAISPFLIQTRLGLDPVQYGWLAVLVSGSLIASRALNAFLISRYALRLTFTIGTYFLLVGGLLMMFLSLVHAMTVASIVGPFLLYILGMGLVMSNAMVGAFEGFRHRAGSAASLYTFTQMVGVFIISSIAAHLHGQTAFLLSLLLSMTGFTAVVLYSVFTRRCEKIAAP